VIVELMSPSTATVDTGIKRQIYEQTFRTPDYYVYDPFSPSSLQGWHLDANQQYQPLVPNEQGWLWCQRLDLWLGTWEGTIDRETAVWLRFYDQAGNVVLLPEEAAQQQAEAERQRAEVAEQQLATAQQEGLRQGALRQLLRLLTTRFGAVPQGVEQRLQNLDINQLEDLVAVALAVDTVNEFISHLS